VIHKSDWAQNLGRSCKGICSGVCKISYQSEFVWFSFEIKNKFSYCWKQHLLTILYWTVLDFLVFDLRSICFAGLMWVLGTFFNHEISRSLMCLWFVHLLHLNWSKVLIFRLFGDKNPIGSHSPPPLVALPVLQLVSEPVKDFPSLIGSKST
jgi:hypothetical protein